MSDLSDPASQVATNPVPTNSRAGVPSDGMAVTSSGNKEVVGGSVNPPEGLRDATGIEVAIPKEVAAVGVKVRPTTIPIPPAVANMGVKPAGQNIPVQTTSTIVLPLSDSQIASGLHESITSSLRWLTEWCIRRLKQVVQVKKS